MVFFMYKKPCGKSVGRHIHFLCSNFLFLCMNFLSLDFITLNLIISWLVSIIQRCFSSFVCVCACDVWCLGSSSLKYSSDESFRCCCLLSLLRLWVPGHLTSDVFMFFEWHEGCEILERTSGAHGKRWRKWLRAAARHNPWPRSWRIR